jgi:hypothetical protein
MTPSRRRRRHKTLAVAEPGREEVDAGEQRTASPPTASTPQHDAHPARRERVVTELVPGMTGQWLVRSQTSSHIWDLDNMTCTRRPGPASRSGTFDFDHQPVPLTRVERWPRVGATSLAYFDDPTEPDHIEHWRQSSRIESITEILSTTT